MTVRATVHSQLDDKSLKSSYAAGWHALRRAVHQGVFCGHYRYADPVIIVAFPLYKSVPVNWFSSFIAMDKAPVKHYVVMHGPYVTESMRRIVWECLQVPDWDRLVVMEHDMIMPLDGFVRADSYTPDQAVVGPMYFGHTPPFHPIVYMRNPEMIPQYGAITQETVKAWSNNPGLYEVDAVGLGFTSIARHVLEEWPDDMAMFQQDRDWGHDIWFCNHAQEQGHKVYVDTGLQCDHLTEVPVNIFDHLGLKDRGRIPESLDAD